MCKYLLSLIIFIPLLSAIPIILFANRLKYCSALTIAMTASIATMILLFPVIANFDTSTHALQFTESIPWFKSLAINYSLGLDGISLPFLVLNIISTLIVLILYSEELMGKNSYLYLSLIMAMSGLLNASFLASDAMLFYFFFEASLIPLYLIIGIWGGKNRIYASLKFFLYTLCGSVLLLLAFIKIGSVANSFNILSWHKLHLSLSLQKYIFLAMFISFAIKLPMFPVHTWLPDAHVEAPTGGSIILAAIGLKLGGYGFLRFLLAITPLAAHYYAKYIIIISIIAIIYIGFIVISQMDMKKLIAYSSVSHMGFVSLGIFSFNTLGVNGAMMQMISHGLISAGLFACIGVLYDRTHTRNIADYSGVVNTMPRYAVIALFFLLSNCGLPGTSGFIGELMVILGASSTSIIISALAASSLVLSAAYSLWMYKRVYFGVVSSEMVSKLHDINTREGIALTSLLIMVIILGFYPNILFYISNQSINQLLRSMPN